MYHTRQIMAPQPRHHTARHINVDSNTEYIRLDMEYITPHR